MSELDDTTTEVPQPRGESRWPVTAAVLAAIVLQSRVPESLSVGPSYGIPVIAALLLVPLIAAHPRHFGAGDRNVRPLALALISAINIGNLTSLALLLRRLTRGSSLEGRQLIRYTAEIWFTGIIVYGLWLWELDRGGPVARSRGHERAPDLLFPQMTDPTLARGWRPTFVDYLYVSLTNSTAFSPTDTMPLSTRVKLIMGGQALASLATVVILGARAVNILR